MDETLLHTSTRTNEKGFDFKVLVPNEEGKMMHVKVFLRPHLYTFLEAVSKLYEIIVFTASCDYYADVVLDLIDPSSKSLLTREVSDQATVSKRLHRGQ